MSATRAFDLALFVPQASPNVGDGVVTTAAGLPVATQFAPLVVGAKSGIVIGNSMPAANAKDQILISGAGPGFAWALGVNPAAAASVPPPTAQFQLIMADAGPTWQTTAIATVLGLGGAITVSAGGVLNAGANIAFTPMISATVRLDGGDPNVSMLDNFTLDCGVF